MNLNNTAFGTLALPNFAVSSGMSSPAATVDLYSSFTLSQTTPGVVLTITTPSNNIIGRIVVVRNIGTVPVTVSGVMIRPTFGQLYMWDGALPRRPVNSQTTGSYPLFKQTNTTSGGASSTAIFTISGTGVGSLTIPAGLLQVGNTIRIKGKGGYRRGAGNTNQFIRFNGVNVLTTGSVNAGAAAALELFTIDADITVRTIGVAGTLIANGNVTYNNNTNMFQMLNTATVAINTTIAQVISLHSQFATSNVNNNIQLFNLSIEIL